MYGLFISYDILYLNNANRYPVMAPIFVCSPLRVHKRIWPIMSRSHNETEIELGLSENLAGQQKEELGQRLNALAASQSNPEGNSLREKLQMLESLSKVDELVLVSQICTSLSLHPPQTQLLDAALGLE